MLNDNKYPSVSEANVFYLLVGLMLITLGGIAQTREIYTGLLITEYLIILAPTVLYLKFKGYSIKDNLRLNKISFRQGILVVFIIIFSYPIAVFFNFIGITILNTFTQLRPNPVPIPSTIQEFLLGFFVIAFTPGICEEAMFRGLIMSSYKKFGKRKAIIYSAILFGVFHFNAQNLLGPIYLGLILGIIAYRTNSLFSTIIGHTVNNTIALVIGYLITNVGLSDLEGNAEISTLQSGEMIFSLLVLGIMALLFGFVVFKLLKLLSEDKNDIRKINNFVEKKSLSKTINEKNNFNIQEVIPIILVIALFIYWNIKFIFI